MSKVVAAVLTSDRPKELSELMDGLASQVLDHEVVIVDAGLTACGIQGAKVVRSLQNLGGAGGFSLAILTALATGAEWVWMMDDDACPVGQQCLSNLLETAEREKLDLVSPIIVAPHDHSRLSFPYRKNGKLTYRRADVESNGTFLGVAHLFNGALIRRDVFFKIGLPDLRLFIRGDEVDFMIRMRRAGVKFGTIPSSAVSHPTGWSEVVPILRNRIAVLVPETKFKRYHFFRNRGYLARRHRRVLSLIADVSLYPFVFLVLQKWNTDSLAEWAHAYWRGLNYDFSMAE